MDAQPDLGELLGYPPRRLPIGGVKNGLEAHPDLGEFLGYPPRGLPTCGACDANYARGDYYASDASTQDQYQGTSDSSQSLHSECATIEDVMLLTEPPPGLEGFALTSEGSVGHPFACGLPCKYKGMARGCKDGTACKCCHKCTWRPWMKTRRGKEALLGSKSFGCVRGEQMSL